MRKSVTLLCFILGIILTSPITAYSQLSKAGTPKSFNSKFKLNTQTKTINAVNNIDVQNLFAQDADDKKLGLPMRFGIPVDVNYTLLNSGVWQTMQDGSKTWTLRIKSQGAYSINLLYDNFWLPDGAKFYIYNEDRTMVIGAFTSQNNKPLGNFATAPVRGDAIILELNVPSQISNICKISISRVVHAYKDIFFESALKDTTDPRDPGDPRYGGSGSCNNNVNCPEGDPWKNEKNSVAMIILDGGWRLCSGVMVNNVRQDLTPYFLTANHCSLDPESFIFMFNYQSPSCSNIDGPTTMTIHGATLLSRDKYSDFTLLLLNETPPDSFNLFYSGWSNVETPATSTVCIHHPYGDIKKISFNDDPVYTVDNPLWNLAFSSHWEVDNWESGTTEAGSSGSPLFDQNHRIVGQLHAGGAACGNTEPDQYGKFSVSWDGSLPTNRLRDWLDPDNFGITAIDGINSFGPTISADTTVGQVPFDVQFSALSPVPVDNWIWNFGDESSESQQNPYHTYSTPGVFNVRLDVTSESEDNYKIKYNYIFALADTLSGVDVESNPRRSIVVTINAANNIPLNKFVIPIEFNGDLNLSFDSASTVGCRTEYFEELANLDNNASEKRVVFKLQSTLSNSQPDLQVGSGAILKLFFYIDAEIESRDSTTIQFNGYTSESILYSPLFSGPLLDYQPELTTSTISVLQFCCEDIRGNFDFDANDVIDISDLVFLVSFMFSDGAAPPCTDEADIDGSGDIDISDLVGLVAFMFSGGLPPIDCP